MIPILLTVLTYLAYAICIVIILEIIFWAVGLLVPVPPKIRQLVYALCGVLLLIAIVGALTGGINLPKLGR